MTVTAPMPERNLNLVVPLAHEATAMRTTETAASALARSGAVTPLIAEAPASSLRRGVDFVGHVIKPWCRSARRRTAAKAVARMRHLPAADVHQVANSYFGLLNQASHSHADRARLANAVRDRDLSVNRALTQTYRKGT